MADVGPFSRERIWIVRGLLGVSVIAAILFVANDSARAQVRSSRALRSVEIDRIDEGWELELEFEFPIRYLRHAPRTPGRTLRVQVEPLPIASDTLLRGSLRQSLPIPRGEPIPLLEIVYEGSLREQPYVEFEFSESLVFDVKEGEDSRSLLIRATLPAKPKLDGEEGEGASREAQLLSRARHAIRDGELDLGIALLTRVIELPSDEVSEQARMEARELIALTHERRGQLAHAEAEYEAYLEDYPDGAAATRVRQRLEALRTADAQPRSEPLRRASRASSREDDQAIRRDLFGSIAARYFRFESVVGDADGNFRASDVLADMDLAGRLDAESWALRADFVGTYDVDISGQGRSDDARISRLSIDVEDRLHGLEATLGRQRRSDSGVLGRFDGLRVAAEIGSYFSVSALAGLPVESTGDRNPNTDTLLAGGAIDFQGLGLRGLQGQIFAVGRRTESLTDRAAIGGELRYSNDKTYSFVYLDYDVVFDSLNTFLASSTYRYSDETDFRILVDRRNGPVLTLSSALQGLPVADIGDLKDLFTDNQIRELALDRTAVFWLGTIGATHRPTDRLQVSTDLSVSHVSGTSTSVGIQGNDSTGPNFAVSMQLIASDWWVDNGVGSISVRYFEGDLFRSVMLSTYSRFMFFEDLRILPRLRWEWRDSTFLGSQSLMRPSLEADWRYGPILLNAEVGIDWREPISGGNASQEVSYFVETGIRWEF